MPTAYVFDAYGTLFDVHSAAGRYRDAIGPDWDRLSQIWRTKHLEYTWIHAQTGSMTTFRILAERSLDYAIASVGSIPKGLREKLLDAYMTLSAYPEVPEVLSGLKAAGAQTAILSNGDPEMLDAAVASAGIGDLLDAVISVRDAGIFKPDMRVYALATGRFSCAPADISFQSSNRWDAAGATVFGMRSVWINRFGMPDEYPDQPAARVLKDLRPLLEEART
jgi:2-haloacid dehalogenase